MKIILEFNEEEKADAELSLNAWKYKYALDEVWEKVFRPNNKHGYNNSLLDSDEAYEIIEELTRIYLEVKEDL